MMWGTIVSISVLLVISAISKGIMDVLQFHYEESVFSQFKTQQWWNPHISHKNKYKNGKKINGSAFFGSTTFLVFITDGWHFFQSIFLSSIIFSILLAINLETHLNAWFIIGGYLIIKIIFGLIFELCYSKIFR